MQRELETPWGPVYQYLFRYADEFLSSLYMRL